jgi:hypothetical protein
MAVTPSPAIAGLSWIRVPPPIGMEKTSILPGTVASPV